MGAGERFRSQLKRVDGAYVNHGSVLNHMQPSHVILKELINGEYALFQLAPDISPLNSTAGPLTRWVFYVYAAGQMRDHPGYIDT